MIKKPSIIITSGGRTGTEFYSKMLPLFIPGSAAYHEPERITRFYSIKEIRKTISNFGILNSTIRKIERSWGLRPLSHQRIRSEVEDDVAVDKIINLRKRFIEKQEEDIYIESSYHYYGLIDLLPHVFEDHRLAYIVRDGREWVRSHMNSTKWYSKKHLPSRLNMMLRPDVRDKYFEKWKEMDEFARLCWLWQKISNYAEETIAKNKNAKMFYFEDLFKSDERVGNQIKLLDFVTSVKGGTKYRFDDNCLKKRVNKTQRDSFPKWDDWSPQHKVIFKEIAGSTMNKFDYTIC